MGAYDFLSTRAAFNRAVRHLQSAISVDEELAKKKNIADILNVELAEGNLQKEQLLPIVNALLVTKHGYAYRSDNMQNQLTEFDKLVSIVEKWNVFDFVISYHHPVLGFSLINPKNKSHLDSLHDIMRDELIVAYCRYVGKETDTQKVRDLTDKGISALFKLLNSQDIKDDQDFIDASIVVSKVEKAVIPANAQVRKSASMQVTPKYSIQVSNELFHNGNVEAWKNIIESYQAAHPDLTVTVYHDGELIQELATLFKWGKVKHGGLIFFQVAGENIRGVAKLKRYLHEGASSRFENFMKKDMSRPLKLF